MLSIPSWGFYAGKIELGRAIGDKFLYSDGYFTHYNIQIAAKLAAKKIKMRKIIKRASLHMQPVDNGPGKFMQDWVHSLVENKIFSVEIFLVVIFDI